MNNSIYEPHAYKEGTLPFIFHIDTLSASYTDAHPDGKLDALHFKIRCLQNWHENIELLYITEGTGSIICNTVAHELKAGDIAIVNSFDLHYTETYTNMKYYCLIPDKIFLEQNGLNISKASFVNVLADPIAANLFLHFTDEFINRRTYSELGIKTALLSLLLYLARNHTRSGEQRKESKTLSNIRLAIGYINSHLSERINADNLSFEVGLSKYHFLREFKKITGNTLISYINKMRCEKARSLLSDTDMPVSEICAECGFDNNSYFTKLFKCETGTTLSEYRRLYHASMLKSENI